ncbi:hypothetical protein GGS23DRAFT_34000 [Durotheca rogersii]|uniref:uncharacterized protein n=1 Tax=Durotheca rogersii TaxID=419775 RepID=UPI00222121C0|nr:uncharacterized protein GGS23DRAFT_34000 [Durotheca rogersii]KAI5868505.1 hypothetical protein GGS23DRAFT_34000 [Durotheca rogersii]
MAGKKGGVNGKKVAGRARKAEAAAKKAAVETAKRAAEEDAEWEKGAKNNSRKEAQATKKAEQARKKAERDAALAEEEKSLPSRAGPKNSKTAIKKTKRGDIDDLLLSQPNPDNHDNKKLPSLAASGVDKSLHVLDLALVPSSDIKVDKHPERRVKAAYAVFEERRLQEMDEDGSGAGLRLNQKRTQIKLEFNKSTENPLNNPLNSKYNATRGEIEETKEEHRTKAEAIYAIE